MMMTYSGLLRMNPETQITSKKEGDIPVTGNKATHDADALVASILGNAEASTSRPTTKREHSQSDDENVKKAKIEEVEDEEIVENENIDDKQAIKLVESAPRITIHTLDTPESCTHEVVVPPGHEFEALKPSTREPD